MARPSRVPPLPAEPGRALLALAEQTFSGEILAMIDPRNLPSQSVARKLGFVLWKQAVVDGFLDNLYRRQIGTVSIS